MKLALALAFLVGNAAAFNQMTMMARRVAPSKAVPAAKRSLALPFTTTTLDTGLAGDVGFDPFDLAGAESMYPPFDTIKWYREAELQHGRVAQLAIVGFIWPQLFGTFPSTDEYDYSQLNPVEALYKCPSFALVQIVLFIGALEGRRYQRCFKGDAAPGDQNLGVPGGFNIFNLNYSDEEYALMELREIKHCRLAMIAAIGALVQNLVQGEGVAASLGKGVFAIPEFSSKAGYYFPEGL